VIKFDVELDVPSKLDCQVTPELKKEGEVRELIRAIQQRRKDLNLHPEDRVSLALSPVLQELTAGFTEEIKSVTGAVTIESLADEDSIVVKGLSPDAQFSIKLIS
jgi:isoleucyl-tRNA synthetase